MMSSKRLKFWEVVMSSPRLSFLIFLLLVPTMTACGAHLRSHSREVGFAPTSEDGPQNGPSQSGLRDLAEELGVEGASIENLRRSLAALEELERGAEAQDRLELVIMQARVMQFMVDSQADESDVVRWCRRGDRLAETIREMAPERVEGHYYGAIFLGVRAQHQQFRASMWLDDLETFGRSAVEIDETYDDAGPLRFLGMLLVSAPAWPLGPGDEEEGVEILQHAVEVSDYPLNKLLLARGLIESGDEEMACDTLSEAFTAPQVGRWAVTGPRWRPEAEHLAAQISCQLQSPPGYANL